MSTHKSKIITRTSTEYDNFSWGAEGNIGISGIMGITGSTITTTTTVGDKLDYFLKEFDTNKILNRMDIGDIENFLRRKKLDKMINKQ